MKACVLQSVGDLRYQEVETAACKKGEVLVHIKACGICGSDIPRVFTKGTYHFPTIPGHEFAGIVEEAGEAVDQAWIGKWVTVFPLLPCRTCEACQKGKYAQCENYNYYGSRCDGGFSEYISVPVWNLVEIPEGVEPEEAAMCEPAAVAYHAAAQAGNVSGENVLVSGAGTIGMITAMWLRASGASRVILVDIDERKLQFAERLGFESTICLQTESVLKRIQELTDGEGISCAFECVGTAGSLENCLEAAEMSGTVVVVGNPAGDMVLSQKSYWNILRKELRICGTWNSQYGGKNSDWKKVMKALQRKQIQLKELVTHRFPLAEHEKAFEVLRDRTEFAVKVMFINEER